MAAVGLIPIILALILGLGLLTGAIFLQIFLSRKAAAWPGLILPGVTLLLSLVVALGVATFSVVGMTVVDPATGAAIPAAPQHAISGGSVVFTAGVLFLLYNIPTGVLLAIYAACRGKRRRDGSMEEMRIQDIE